MAKKKGSLSIIELHLEKGLLALAVLFMLFLGVRYLGMEPNTIEYNGQQVGPDQIDEAIKSDAEQLSRAIETARPEAATIPEYARQLQRQFEGGIFTSGPDDGPPPPKTLRVAALFGPELPVFEDQIEEKDIVLVKPLPPRDIAVRTGISQVYRRQLTIGAEPNEEGTPTGKEGLAELSWVSVGGYFPREAQQREMTKAGYAGYRAKVYLVGLDVQRQEMTPSGKFSDWVDVEPSQAMPKLTIPNPVYDDKSGELINQEELDLALNTVRAYRQAITQPYFYPIYNGDDWLPPPLPGQKFQEEEQPEEEKPKAEEKKSPPRGGGRMAPPSGGGRTGGRGRMGGRMGGGRMGPGGGRMGGGRTGGPAPPREKTPTQRAKEELKQARKAMREKKWDEALRLANGVVNSSELSKSLRRQGERIVRDAQRRIDREQGRTTGLVPRPQPQLGFVQNPEKEGEPAIWFHDDSVEPGKTYRYRLRARLWNRYVGRRDVLKETNRELADQTVLVGEWSLPSAPITVAPKQHFFVTGRSFGEPAASVDVFKWYNGNWLKEDFTVKVGDVIGGVKNVKVGLDDDFHPKRGQVDFSTDALVLDLRFDEPVMFRRAAGKEGEFAYRDTQAVVLVYLDPADGQVKERVSDVDKSDPLYKRLKEEWEEFKDSL